MRAIEIRETGGPDVLLVVDVPDPVPGPGELLVRVEAAGINFIDTYFRSGLYPRELPYVAGAEGAGVIEQVGPSVTEFCAGQRVAWATGTGTYAEKAVVPSHVAVAVPDGVPADKAASTLLQGMTAHYLLESTYPAAEGDSICEPIGDGVLLRVIVKPGQAEDAVLDVKDYCAMVSLRAPIEDRWCNQALLAFCRRALHVPQRERNAVKIMDGDESLDKIVHIPALSPKEVIKRLHKKKDFEVDTNDVEKWIRHTERKQKEEERRMKRRKWA